MVQVYGAEWCHDTQATRNQLDSLGVQYDYKDIDADSDAAQWVRDHNGGKRKLPTLDVEGEILSVPNERELEVALRGKGLMG